MKIGLGRSASQIADSAWRLAIDYTAGANQRAGIGRYTRELVRALLAEITDDEPRTADGGERTADQGGPTVVHGPRSTVHRPPSIVRRPDVQLLVPRRQALPLPAAPPGVRYRRLPLTEWQAVSIWHRLGIPLPVNLLTGRLDVFHEPDFLLPPVRAGRRLVTIHDLSYLIYPELAHPAMYRYLVRAVPRSLDRADHVIAVSESTKRDLIRLLGIPPERITVIAEGVDPVFRPDPEPSDPVVLARLGLPARYLLTVGTIQPRKNYTRLLEACERVWQQSPETPDLVIAGQRGWLFEEFFRQLEASRFRSRVRVLDLVADADLPALYRGAEIFIYPSCYEGFGLPPLEALACGRPVICSNASSLPEVVGEAARLIDPLDVAALADAIGELSADAAQRAELARRGPGRAAKFTWRNTAQQHLAVYRGEC